MGSIFRPLHKLVLKVYLDSRHTSGFLLLVKGCGSAGTRLERGWTGGAGVPKLGLVQG